MTFPEPSRIGTLVVEVQFSAEQIDVGLAHELGWVGEPEVGGHPLADAEQAALTILEVDAVLRVLHERTEARLLGQEIELSHHRTTSSDTSSTLGIG